ncbi:S8 family peptidase [Actinoplanes derwentensis]|uniref:Type VII secretion-associated serine protease mycosin n=1 Tax=Actinoplanes derwentensis TaxID=113562 RepID=A0A1H2D911_9ACTN|nr:S8 family peptidase [Actinoplanes derwentensis]GID86385.1 hypothetical protein Ade03nite_53090 [Actinoplanes derwentensis]SDT79074.1 type VII secretion-associated serine protease mycosin [Actinoplanes derwentensis]
MRVRRNFLAGGIVAVTAAAVGVFALPTGSQAFSPVSYGSGSSPVRVVTTSLDATGRPVFSVQVAGSAAQATRIAAAAVQKSATVAVEVDSRVHALDVPADNDPYRTKQWDLAKISVPDAWESSTGNGVVVAVIDTGVDGTHPDLAGQVLAGYDAIEDVAGGDTDVDGHGTHVAGTIAAIAGNGKGIAGIAPDAEILPVKVLDANGEGFTSDTAEGIVWAADNGADVINLSLGGTEADTAQKTAIAYARNKGVTVIAAAGNEREEGSPVSYPAAFPGVIAVAATDSSDEVGVYSNEGDYVDVAAPGTGIVSTVPGGKYSTANGTSMASPHVAAVAALLKAYQPAITPDEIEETLENTAVDLGTTGFDNDFGNGRIDAAAALESLGAGGGDDDGGDDDSPRPEVTVDQEDKTVTYGTKTKTTFSVTAGDEAYADQDAQLCLTIGGVDQGCDDVTTDSDGEVVVSRVATGTFQISLEVASGDDSVESPTASVAYTVKAAVKATKSGKGAITVKVTGATGQKMTLQRLVKGKWSTAKTYSATASRKITGLVAGGSYRVVLASTKTVVGVTSGTVKA